MEDIELSNPCEKCGFLLGQTTHVTGVKEHYGAIFYTISPDPMRDNFGEKTPDSQKRWIDLQFLNSLGKLRKHFKTHMFSKHYELNKSGNIHIHGILFIDPDLQGNNINLCTASKVFHKHFGRQYYNAFIDSKMEWIADDEVLCKYVNKENVYPSEHRTYVNEQCDVTMYLTKGSQGATRPQLNDNK